MKQKILIADDDRDIVSMLKDRLEAEGYETFHAYEGIRAVEMANKRTPDLILLDLKMPSGDGQTVLQFLRARPNTKNIPVIVLTALTGDNLEQEVLTAGANDFMRKPYDTEALLAKIRSFL